LATAAEAAEVVAAAAAAEAAAVVAAAVAAATVKEFEAVVEVPVKDDEEVVVPVMASPLKKKLWGNLQNKVKEKNVFRRNLSIRDRTKEKKLAALRENLLNGESRVKANDGVSTEERLSNVLKMKEPLQDVVKDTSSQQESVDVEGEQAVPEGMDSTNAAPESSIVVPQGSIVVPERVDWRDRYKNRQESRWNTADGDGSSGRGSRVDWKEKYRSSIRKKSVLDDQDGDDSSGRGSRVDWKEKYRNSKTSVIDDKVDSNEVDSMPIFGSKSRSNQAINPKEKNEEKHAAEEKHASEGSPVPPLCDLRKEAMRWLQADKEEVTISSYLTKISASIRVDSKVDSNETATEQCPKEISMVRARLRQRSLVRAGVAREANVSSTSNVFDDAMRRATYRFVPHEVLPSYMA